MTDFFLRGVRKLAWKTKGRFIHEKRPHAASMPDINYFKCSSRRRCLFRN